MAIESPKYEMLRRDGKIEVRNYDACIVAEVVLESSFDPALSEGFRILADYIFGSNQQKVSVSMTSPVTQQLNDGRVRIPMTTPVTAQDQGKSYKVAFFMPSKYTLETLPQPNDQRVSFHRIESRQIAAIRFSGYLTEKAFIKKKTELSKWLTTNNITTKSSYYSAQYNPPWVPWFARRNEVMVET